MSEASIWPPIIIIAILAMGLGIELVRDGQPKSGKHNFWADLIGTSLVLLLLWWGGFFVPLTGGAS